VKETVSVAQATSDEPVLPERVQEALGELVGAAKEGLLALSVAVGVGVLTEMLEEEVDEVVGPKGKWNRDRTAVRPWPRRRGGDTRWSPGGGSSASGADRGR
jgi:hypothetical protein